MKIAIIDYQLSNLFSVKHAFDHLGIDSQITSDKSVIAESDAAIIPGVGAFGDAMNNLKKLNLINLIKEFISSGKPFMGVCLGLQLLFTESEEFGVHKGLDIVKGKVIKFSSKQRMIKVPQIGWNQISKAGSWENTPLKNIKNGEFMYFVHSYYVSPVDSNVSLAKTTYEDIQYTSAIITNNVFAVQFHPEKSGLEGIKIYRNWLEL